MDVNVLYGNCYGGYSLHDPDRVRNGKDYQDRVPMLVNLVKNSGAHVFLAVEMHEDSDSSFGAAGSGAGYFFNALKAADADWAWFPGKSGNQCFYRPSKITTVGDAVYKRMPGDRSMMDFRLRDTATSFDFHALLNHFRADDNDYTTKSGQHRDGKGRSKERKQQAEFVANYVAPLQSAIIVGDFNSSTDKAGYPRAIFKAAGFQGLRQRGSVTNGTRSTRSYSSNAHFWIEDIFTRKAQSVSSSSLIPTNNASDHYGWLLTTITWPAATVAISQGIRPATSSSDASYAGLPWEVRVRNPDLTLGAPLRFTRAELTENYCGSPLLVLTGRTSDLDAAGDVGSGVVLTDDQGQIRLSGRLFSFSRSGKQTMSLTFKGDASYLSDRITWPNPAAAWSKSGQTSAYHVTTGPAEDRLLTYVNTQLGPSARTERKLTTLRLPASKGRGPSAVTSSRFEVLGDVCAVLGEAASIHFGIRQAWDGSTPYLEFYIDDAPNLSDWVHFGTPEAGGPYMLTDDWGYGGTKPQGTTILGAAGGELTDRILNSATDGTAESLWGRVEFFLDQRSQTDTTEIASGLAKALLDNAGALSVAVPLGSVPGLGTTIPIGAVAAASLDGQLVTDRIRQITTVLSSADGDAPTVVGGVLGTPDSGVKSPTWRQINRMLGRIRNLEAR